MSEPVAVTAPALVLVCPACGGHFDESAGELRCTGCARRFRLVAGNPDFLLDRDPSAHDVRRAEALAARASELDLGGLLREYWRTTERPPELTERFTQSDLHAEAKAEQTLAAVEEWRGAPIGPHDRVLEVGCGTGALAAAAARRGAETVATDISPAWVVLAAKRLSEAEVDRVALASCAAEALPLPAESCDLVLAGDVIEHVADPEAFVAGCARVLRPGGLLFLATPNRYSLGLEPHVRLWGVGYLPRRLAERYVRAVRHSTYSHVRLLSAGQLERLLRAHGLAPTIVCPPVPEAAQGLYGGLELALVRAYNRVRGARPARGVLRAVGPFFHVFGRREAS